MKFNPTREHIVIGGEEHVVYALPAGVMIYDVFPLIKALSESTKTLTDALPQMSALLAQALNDPEITQDTILGSLLTSDISEAFWVVVRLSGSKRESADAKMNSSENPTGVGSSGVS